MYLSGSVLVWQVEDETKKINGRLNKAWNKPGLMLGGGHTRKVVQCIFYDSIYLGEDDMRYLPNRAVPYDRLPKPLVYLHPLRNHL